MSQFLTEGACPGCGQPRVLDALSRYDDQTVICAECSSWEAKWQAVNRGAIPLSAPGKGGGENRFSSPDPLTDHR